jgi:hypothetical protein
VLHAGDRRPELSLAHAFGEVGLGRVPGGWLNELAGADPGEGRRFGMSSRKPAAGAACG